MADTSHLAKKMARLAAVQALYQNDYALTPVAQIIRHEVEHGFPALRDDEAEAGQTPDAELFGQIVSGVAANQPTLNEMLTGALSANLSASRMEKLLRMILHAGIYELHHHGQIPAKIIINDYVDVAHAFFNAKEPGLVNGILDKLAGKLRAA